MLSIGTTIQRLNKKEAAFTWEPCKSKKDDGSSGRPRPESLGGQAEQI